MNTTKKALKNFVDKEQKRVIMVTITEDGKLELKGDHISFTNLEEDEGTQEALKKILTLINAKRMNIFTVNACKTQYEDITHPFYEFL